MMRKPILHGMKKEGLDYAEYTKGGTLYKIWLENAKSLELKLKEVESGKMAGSSFWKAGMEKKSVRDTMREIYSTVDYMMQGSKYLLNQTSLHIII